MTTRKTRQQVPSVPEDEPVTLDNEAIETLKLLRKKVMNSPALNGGFVHVVEKVDNIDARVEAIHQAIYHPDNGLYARVKEVQVTKERLEVVEQLERDMANVQRDESAKKIAADKEAKVAETNAKILIGTTKRLSELERFKQRVSSIARWTFTLFGAATATLLGKLVYDLVTGHITFH